MELTPPIRLNIYFGLTSIDLKMHASIVKYFERTLNTIQNEGIFLLIMAIFYIVFIPKTSELTLDVFRRKI